MKSIISLLGLLLLLAAGTGAFIWSGTYNIAADDPHWPATHQLMETMRDRSIEAHASGIAVPDLDSESLIRAGAGNYHAMCAGCHLHPGVERSEISAGLYPAPPDLVRHPIDNPAEAFWTIKHGIKMTGMPAWGKSMEDEYIWGMVAFLRKLPDLSDEKYDGMVEASGGHSHGSGESHDHADDEHDEHDEHDD